MSVWRGPAIRDYSARWHHAGNRWRRDRPDRGRPSRAGRAADAASDAAPPFDEARQVDGERAMDMEMSFMAERGTRPAARRHVMFTFADAGALRRSCWRSSWRRGRVGLALAGAAGASGRTSCGRHRSASSRGGKWGNPTHCADTRHTQAYQADWRDSLGLGIPLLVRASLGLSLGLSLQSSTVRQRGTTGRPQGKPSPLTNRSRYRGAPIPMHQCRAARQVLVLGTVLVERRACPRASGLSELDTIAHVSCTLSGGLSTVHPGSSPSLL